MINSDSFIKDLKSNLSARAAHLKQELAGIRSNRPTPELLENIKVNLYEQTMTIQQLGSIMIRPPRELIVQPWDKSAMPAIMKGIEDAKLGVSVSNDDTSIIVSIPSLTSERKEQLSKLIKKTAEETRIAVRSIRDERNKEIKAAESAKELTEDQAFKLKEDVQKLVNEVNGEIESIVEKKLIELEN